MRVKTKERLTTPEAARRLGVSPADVYRLLFAGELDGGPGPDGVVSVTADSVEEYQVREADRSPKRTGS